MNVTITTHKTTIHWLTLSFNYNYFQHLNQHFVYNSSILSTWQVSFFCNWTVYTLSVILVLSDYLFSLLTPSEFLFGAVDLLRVPFLSTYSFRVPFLSTYSFRVPFLSTYSFRVPFLSTYSFRVPFRCGGSPLSCVTKLTELLPLLICVFTGYDRLECWEEKLAGFGCTIKIEPVINRIY